MPFEGEEKKSKTDFMKFCSEAEIARREKTRGRFGQCGPQRRHLRQSRENGDIICSHCLILLCHVPAADVSVIPIQSAAVVDAFVDAGGTLLFNPLRGGGGTTYQCSMGLNKHGAYDFQSQKSMPSPIPMPPRSFFEV